MMKSKYHSAVITRPGTVHLEICERNRPGPNEVGVRLQGCGVCGSNLPVWEGRPWFQYPFAAGAPGHEGWGIIEEVGCDVSGLRDGQRVALLSYHAFGEHENVSATHVVPLPGWLDNQPFPGEALGCAMNIFHRAEIKAGQHVAVIGTGFLGALLTQLATSAGAHVIAISRRPASLEIAEKMGAKHLIPMEDHQAIIDETHRITGGGFCERVIEATGAQWPLDLAGELCAERGRLMIAGYHQDGPRQVNMQLWNWRGLDVINAHERDPAVYLEGMRAAIDAIAGGQMNPAALYSDRFKLGDLGMAFRSLGSRSGSFTKGIMIYE